ncbi:hypothetical protein PCY52_000089 [Staphylococcus pseudintermedius]|nr:hypothetical protein [Staphylococcus pseudintermedius]
MNSRKATRFLKLEITVLKSVTSCTTMLIDPVMPYPLESPRRQQTLTPKIK